MREELKALRAEVERLRAEVEQQKTGAPTDLRPRTIAAKRLPPQEDWPRAKRSAVTAANFGSPTAATGGALVTAGMTGSLAPTASVFPKSVFPQSASEPPREKGEDRSVFRLGLDLAERQPAHQRSGFRFKILHPGNPRRCYLHLRLQQTGRQLDRRFERNISLQRNPVGATRSRWRFPL